MGIKRLSPEAFERACQFLKTCARPLDAAMFEYRFQGCPAEGVLTELRRFQNRDGGFGRALEPDLRTPSSSALATGIGLRLLEELRCDSDHPMVSGAVRYLLSTFDHETQVWRIVPWDTGDFPHAPWWVDEDGSLGRLFDGFVINPRAEIVALLYHHSSLVPSDWLDDVAESTVTDIETIEALGTGGGDDLCQALSLAESESFPSFLRDRVVARVLEVVPAAVSRDPERWGTYCIPPLKLATTPRSIVAGLLWDDLQVNLDYEIDRQGTEGSWDPVWTWGDLYPKAWERAKLEWRGHLTLNTLTTLRAYGRIPE